MAAAVRFSFIPVNRASTPFIANLRKSSSTAVVQVGEIERVGSVIFAFACRLASRLDLSQW
jgi:hypothetical protein